jgi:hypothetical protein
MSDSNPFFIEANYEGTKTNKSYKPYHTIKEIGENTFRIAPPCRSLVTAPNPDYAIFNKVHFGYGVQDDQNPDKIRARPFYCIHKTDYKTKMVLVQCPECAKIKQVVDEMEALKAKLTNEGHPKDYITQAVSPQAQWLQSHNLDNKWYGYAKNLAGEWNVIKIGHKAKLALDDRMKRTFREDGIKALDPASGVWFKFTKNGLRGPNALTTVEVLKEKVDMGNGVKAEVVKSAPLTESDVKSIEGLQDVTNICARLTKDQIQALVDSAGNPDVAKTIFALGTKTATSQVTLAAATVPSTTTVVTPEVKAAVVTTPPKASTKEIADMNADAFLRMFAKS